LLLVKAENKPNLNRCLGTW